MRFRPELSSLALACLLAVSTPALSAEAPSREQVERAIEAVKADPNLASHRTARRLVWDNPEEKEVRKPSKMPGWLRWFTDFFGWIAETSQLLFWLLILTLIGVIVVFLLRLFAARAPRWRAADFVAPTHVQDLDIRPESLPDDIGAAARQLWDRGERRAALALLYRGLLSRLAHGYRVPIRDSSTEGDCLAIAARTLDARRIGYATRLVRVWQQAIYGGLDIDSAEVHELCAEFDAHLERPSPVESPRREAYGAAT